MEAAVIARCVGALEGAAFNRAVVIAPHLDTAMKSALINTPARQAAFLAQVGHESGGLRWMEEIWGPTAAQLRYEPPSHLAEKLGNIAPGDGARFKGRGPIQLTGRYNYAQFSEWAGVDFVAAPQMLSQPEWGCKAAAWFWMDKGLNELADQGRFVVITRRINGGLTHLAERTALWASAQHIIYSGATA